MTKNNTVIIYHGNCSDGLSAAAVTNYFLNKNMGITEVEFYPGYYSSSLPNYKDSTIFMVDFSYKLENMKQLLDAGNKIIFIDHHKSAIADLESLREDPRITFYVSEDNTLSGTGLAWRFFTLHEDMPLPLKFIQDRDLWNWSYDQSAPYLQSLELMDRSIESYCDWVTNLIDHPEQTEQHVTHHVTVGESLLQYKKTLIESAVKSNLVFIDILDYHNIPTINTLGTFVSDTGNYLNVTYPEAPFTICWEIQEKGIKLGLRSLKGSGADVSKVAQKFDPSGGGHFNSAGVLIKNSSPNYQDILQRLTGNV